MFRLFFVALFIFSVSLLAQKAPFSIEALYKIKNVSDPQISPDGRMVAFTVTSYIMHKGQNNSEIYIMDIKGGHLRRMTDNPAADYQPRWSADGQNLLFVSTRKEGPQAWLMPVNGGEPRQLTCFNSGVSDARWAGSSKRIIFKSRVFPECGADNDCNQEILEDMKNGPLQAHMADRLLFRHWTFYKDGRRAHLILFDPETKTYKDLTPGDYDSPPLWGAFSVSADGKKLCVESNRGEFEAETTNNDLFLINIGTLETKNLTAANQAYDGQPVFSPNGRFIAYEQQKIPGYESDLKRLAVYDLKKQKTRTLTGHFDNWVEQYHWGPNSQTVYFRAHERGHFPIYRINIQSGKIIKVVDVKTADAFAVSPSGRKLVISRRTINHPSELVLAATTGRALGKRAKRLTFFNKALEDSVDIRPAEEMWILSPSGKKIHTFIVKPHNFNPHKKYPLILNVHGGPQYQWYDGFRGDWQVYPGSGYIVAFPNPHGSTGYGQAFTREISGDYSGKVYQDVMAVSDSLAHLSYVDANRIGAMGWSWGGYMMMWLEGHTQRFKAIVSMMGVFDLTSSYGSTEELWFPEFDNGGTPWQNRQGYEKNSPSTYVPNFKTPCLVIAGEKDYRVPYTQSLEFFTSLQKMRVPSRLIVFKDDGHWPNYVKSMPFYYNAHLDWFNKYLGGKPAPYNMKKMWRNEAYEYR